MNKQTKWWDSFTYLSDVSYRDRFGRPYRHHLADRRFGKHPYYGQMCQTPSELDDLRQYTSRQPPHIYHAPGLCISTAIKRKTLVNNVYKLNIILLCDNVIRLHLPKRHKIVEFVINYFWFKKNCDDVRFKSTMDCSVMYTTQEKNSNSWEKYSIFIYVLEYGELNVVHQW